MNKSFDFSSEFMQLMTKAYKRQLSENIKRGIAQARARKNNENKNK